MRLWTVAQGTGVPLLLCNGGPGCCDYLAPVADLLQETATIIRFEERGCGRSDQVSPYSITNSLFDLESIRRHYGFQRWLVGGHSWGAELALIYALHYPEHTLAVIGISGGRMNDNRTWHRIYHERQTQGLEVLPTFDYPPNPEVNAQENHAWKDYIQQPSLLKALSSLNRPALFLYGDQDIRPAWPVEQVANLLPNARFELIDGANHYIWRTHAEQVKTSIHTFIKTVQADTVAESIAR